MENLLASPKRKAARWYKEPWMLVVIGGPAFVVLASLFTAFLAYKGADRVVAQDYYKQGLMINKDIQRDANARQYHLNAEVILDAAAGKVMLHLEGSQLPSAVYFSIAGAVGATTNELVRKIILPQVRPGWYEGDLKKNGITDAVYRSLWHVKIETTDWRLTADWHEPTQNPLRIRAVN
jgi:uncharacterized protein